MAFGFPAGSAEQIDLSVSRQAAKEAAVYAFQLLGWPFNEEGPDRLCSQVGMSGASWGETFTLSFESPGAVEIKSVCAFPLQVFDWGKNKRNIDRFVAHFTPRLLRDEQLSGSEPTYLDAKLRTPLDRAMNDPDAS